MQRVLFDPVTNREDWIQQCEVRGDDTGDLIDLTGATIVVAVRDKVSKVIPMVAQTSDGSVVIQGIGFFQFTFPVATMRGLDAKTYEIGCTILLNGVTGEFFIGTVPVIDGIVSSS